MLSLCSLIIQDTLLIKSSPLNFDQKPFLRQVVHKNTAIKITNSIYWSQPLEGLLSFTSLLCLIKEQHVFKPRPD